MEMERVGAEKRGKKGGGGVCRARGKLYARKFEGARRSKAQGKGAANSGEKERKRRERPPSRDAFKPAGEGFSAEGAYRRSCCC